MRRRGPGRRGARRHGAGHRGGGAGVGRVAERFQVRGSGEESARQPAAARLVQPALRRLDHGAGGLLRALPLVEVERGDRDLVEPPARSRRWSSSASQPRRTGSSCSSAELSTAARSSSSGSGGKRAERSSGGAAGPRRASQASAPSGTGRPEDSFRARAWRTSERAVPAPTSATAMARPFSATSLAKARNSFRPRSLTWRSRSPATSETTACPTSTPRPDTARAIQTARSPGRPPPRRSRGTPAPAAPERVGAGRPRRLGGGHAAAPEHVQAALGLLGDLPGVVGGQGCQQVGAAGGQGRPDHGGAEAGRQRRDLLGASPADGHHQAGSRGRLLPAGAGGGRHLLAVDVGVPEEREDAVGVERHRWKCIRGRRALNALRRRWRSRARPARGVEAGGARGWT